MKSNGHGSSDHPTDVSVLQKKAPRGRPFAKGNLGRKPGSRNRTTLLAQWLSEEDKEALIKKGKELALNGDSRLLKFFLERILPKDCSETLDLPTIENHDDLAQARLLLLRAVARGEITAERGSELSALLANVDRTLSDAEFEKAVEREETEFAKISKRVHEYDQIRAKKKATDNLSASATLA